MEREYSEYTAIRDAFATQAMRAIMQDTDLQDITHVKMGIAEDAYEMADAMMYYRDKALIDQYQARVKRDNLRSIDQFKPSNLI